MVSLHTLGFMVEVANLEGRLGSTCNRRKSLTSTIFKRMRYNIKGYSRSKSEAFLKAHKIARKRGVILIGYVCLASLFSFMACSGGKKSEEAKARAEIQFQLVSAAEEGQPGQGSISIAATEAIDVECINCDNFSLTKKPVSESKATFDFSFRATSGESYLCPLNFKITYKKSSHVNIRRYGVYFCPESAGCSAEAKTGCLIN